MGDGDDNEKSICDMHVNNSCGRYGRWRALWLGGLTFPPLSQAEKSIRKNIQNPKGQSSGIPRLLSCAYAVTSLEPVRGLSSRLVLVSRDTRESRSDDL